MVRPPIEKHFSKKSQGPPLNRVLDPPLLNFVHFLFLCLWKFLQISGIVSLTTRGNTTDFSPENQETTEETTGGTAYETNH